MTNRAEAMHWMVETLAGTAPPQTFANLENLRDWWGRFVQQVFPPASRSPATRCSSAQTLRRANALRIPMGCPADGISHAMDRFVMQSLAMISGVLVLASYHINGRREAFWEVAAFMPVTWASAMRGSGSIAIAYAAATEKPLICAFDNDHPDLTRGVQYVETHCDAEPNEWYAGSCYRHVRRGALAGAPRWPLRHGGHLQCTMNERGRDARLIRYVR